MGEPAQPSPDRQGDQTRPPTRPPRIWVQAVTPVLAEQWLQANPRNRRLRRPYIAQLAGIMRRGEWRFNGDAIRRTPDGALLDGQHRLSAVVEADATVDMLIVEGLEEEAQDTIDRGLRRMLSDTLDMRGYSDAKNLAAALSWLHRFQTGSVWWVKGGAAFPTPAQALELLHQHPGLPNSLRVGSAAKEASFRYPPSLAVALHYLMVQCDSAAADLFFERFIGGYALDEGDAILRLREQVARRGERRLREPPAYVAAWTIKAWNAWRAGRSVRQLRWTGRTGTSVEPFPTLEC